MGEEWGAEKGTQVNRIMKQTLRQMNIIERYITANKDESTPSGWKNLSHNQEKQGTKSPYFFYVVKDGIILSAVFCFLGINFQISHESVTPSMYI